ncbi:protein of unknown function [Caballeronia sp. S22]
MCGNAFRLCVQKMCGLSCARDQEPVYRFNGNRTQSVDPHAVGYEVITDRLSTAPKHVGRLGNGDMRRSWVAGRIEGNRLNRDVECFVFCHVLLLE